MLGAKLVKVLIVINTIVVYFVSINVGAVNESQQLKISKRIKIQMCKTRVKNCH